MLYKTPSLGRGNSPPVQESPDRQASSLLGHPPPSPHLPPLSLALTSHLPPSPPYYNLNAFTNHICTLFPFILYDLVNTTLCYNFRAEISWRATQSNKQCSAAIAVIVSHVGATVDYVRCMQSSLQRRNPKKVYNTDNRFFTAIT